MAAHENRFLAALPREVQLHLLHDMEKVSLPLRRTLYEAHGPVTHVWFPLDSVMSLVLTLRDGVSVEVGTVGNEGFVGVPAYLQGWTSTASAYCQVAGSALKMRADSFRRALEQFPVLDSYAARFTQVMLNQLAQTTACNQAHSVRQRMCRWLLMTQDRVGDEHFHLTQDFLAQMLAVRRPSVTVAAGLLQSAGMIQYRRGLIHITNRAALEAEACECYEVSREELERLFAAAPAPAPLAARPEPASALRTVRTA